MPGLKSVLSSAVLSAMLLAPAMAADTKEVEVDKLKLAVPTTWESEKPSNRLRLAQFVIPKAEGDSEAGELVISPPIGGTPEANIQRWIGQFEADGREAKMTEGTAPDGKYILVNLKGTFKKSIGPPIAMKTTPKPGYRMLGVILQTKAGGNYFFKLTGPDKTVAGQAEALRTAFGAKEADEKEYKLPE
jgi:gluconolactonase